MILPEHLKKKKNVHLKSFLDAGSFFVKKNSDEKYSINRMLAAHFHFLSTAAGNAFAAIQKNGGVADRFASFICGG